MQADSNVGKLDSKRLFKEGLHCKHGSSVSSLSHHEFLRTQQSNLVHGLEAKPSVDEQSDDSDSEIFRVKRRSSLKVEKRFVNDASSSKNYEHQVWWYITLHCVYGKFLSCHITNPVALVILSTGYIRILICV